jgi:hypothetical protein
MRAITRPAAQLMKTAASLLETCADDLQGGAITGSARSIIPRKEVIQPQVPLRLPCYDLVPITELTVGASPLAVGYTTSGTPSFRGLTGGVYKAQEHIHRGVADPRLLAIPTSWRRISASNPNWDRVCAICSLSRVSFVLSRPLWHVCSPGHKGHDDLTSSPPSSVLTTAVSLESPA